MENETQKLLNVLRRIARAAGYASWVKDEPEAIKFCVAQYNRVLARLMELEPSIKPLFTPLSESASPQVVRIAAKELLAYFEADTPDFGWSFELPTYRMRCHPRRVRVGCDVPVWVRCD